MKIAAIIYSVAMMVVALWAWSVYFIYEGSSREHLLPAIVFYIMALPSSLLIERIGEKMPWVISNSIAALSFVTVLGGIQAVLVCLIAKRFKLNVKSQNS